MDRPPPGGEPDDETKTASEPTAGGLVAKAVLQRADAGAAAVPGGLRGALQGLISAENRHEIIALTGRTLTIRWDNYRAFQRSIVPTEPCMVVSFLGDTAAGCVFSGCPGGGHAPAGRKSPTSSPQEVNDDFRANGGR